ncbi:MAG: glycosyltransferase family 2 protein [archaeon]|jgi:glycosyltransferase involved in cell wall biosynthesis|nr:glycosyltransferase family 2 protein [archaeon]
MPSQKVVVTVFAYNEEKTLPKTLGILNGFKKKGIVHEIIVINDGSTDKTAKVAKKFGATVVSNRKNLGKRTTFIPATKAAHRAKADIMIMLDADIVHFPEQTMKNMVNAVSPGKYHMATAQQYELQGAGTSIRTAKRVKTRKRNGQRAFNMKALQPVLNGNKKWIKALTIKWESTSVLYRLAHSNPDPNIRSAAKGLLEEIAKAVKPNNTQFSEMLRKVKHQSNWGLEYALEKLILRGKTRLRSKIYTLPPFREAGYLAVEGQKTSDDLLKGYFKRRKTKAKELRKELAAKRKKAEQNRAKKTSPRARRK